MTGGCKYVDLSGYGFSGKHAVIDLLREFRGFSVPHYSFEFLLLRVPGGILDLEDALVNSWSPLRSDAAIRRFKRLVRRLGARNSLRHPLSLFEAVGWNYNEVYSGRFFDISNRFVDRLITSSWVTDWPFPRSELSGIELFGRKLMLRLGVRAAMDFRMYLSLPADFVTLAGEYLEEVLSSNVPPGTRTIVTHNSFEPFQPHRSLKYFHNAKCIVIDRDPRDSYVQQLTYRPMAVGVEEFVRRFRVYREATRRFSQDHPAVLRIRFEDLIFSYEETLARILSHLEESEDIHEFPGAYFNPAESRRNVGLHVSHARQDEIATIGRELSEYCVD